MKGKKDRGTADASATAYLDTPPVPPEAILRQARVAAELPADAVALRMALADLATPDLFSRVWAIVYRERLVVLDEAGGPPRVHVIDAATTFEVQEGRAANRFRVRRDGRLVEELRFSRRQARGFSEVQHLCDALAKGQADAWLVRAAAQRQPDERICVSCGQRIPEWTDSCPRCLRQGHIFRRLLGYMRPYRKEAWGGVAAALVMTLAMLVPPVLTQRLIDDVLASGDPSRIGTLWALLAALAVAMLVRVAAMRVRFRWLARLGENVAHDLRTQAYAHVQKLSLAWFSRKPTGSIISRIGNDTDRLWDFIAFGIVEIVVAVATVIGVSAIMFWKAPALALLTLVPIPLGLALTWTHTLRMRRFFRRIWRRWSRMTSHLSDTIPGVRVIKAFSQEAREVATFEGRSRDVRDEADRLHGEWTSYWPKISLLLQCGSLIVWAYAGPRILHQEFTLGTFVMFSGLLWMFYGPIEQLGMMNRVFQRAVTSAQRVFEILDTVPTVVSPAAPFARVRLAGAVTFENVTFSYDGIKRVLQDVSFQVEPGEMIGLVGPSGGGKTTLVNLLCRFYDALEGRVLIDGRDVRDYDLSDLRGQVGVVLQEPYLFHGTIADNIAYGTPEASRETVIEAARAAHAHDFVVGFPDGYDTVVGERGQTLSGGERQRISIARAILRDPRILILDEATSSVDTATEKKIQEAIGRLVQGRTTFAIAHRLSTLSAANRLVVLEKGKLLQIGTHAELLAATDGLYAKLHRTQAELQALIAI